MSDDLRHLVINITAKSLLVGSSVSGHYNYTDWCHQTNLIFVGY